MPSRTTSHRSIILRALSALTWLALLLALVHLCANLGAGVIPFSWIYNSDSLFIPAFYHDLHTTGTIAGWDFPTSPYFFPDMLLFLPIYLMVGNLSITVALVGVLQILIFALGIAWIQKRISGF